MKTLYKKDLNGNIRCWKIEVEGNSYRSHSWILGRENTSYQVTEPTYTESRNVGKVNATTAEEQAIKVAEALYRVRYEQGFYDTVEDAGKGKNYFQPMLAAKYFGLNEKKRNDLFKKKAYVQPKLDGCVSGDMVVITDEGKFSLREVVEQGKGKTILSYNLSTGSVEHKPILGRFKNGVDIQEGKKHTWYRIKLSNGKELKLTGNHRVYLPDLKCWRRVDELSGTEKFLSI